MRAASAAECGASPVAVHSGALLYAFDPQRQAVLLLGGDKTGDDRFYERMVPLAEKIWEDYRGGG